VPIVVQKGREDGGSFNASYLRSKLVYDPSLVLLSLIIAIQGSYVALRIALQISGLHGLARRLLLASAACSLAVGIWGMHLIGMLATRLPVSVNYLVLPTLLSFLICVLVVGVALEAVSLWPRTYFTLTAAPIVMGSGIVAMHYTGMWALHASTHMVHNPIMVATSILISIVASAMALWLNFDVARRPSLFVSVTLASLEPDDRLNVVNPGSRLRNAQHPNTRSEGRRTWIPTHFSLL
jgi:NO-binding membrane sensor protein with MHYT domain